MISHTTTLLLRIKKNRTLLCVRFLIEMTQITAVVLEFFPEDDIRESQYHAS